MTIGVLCATLSSALSTLIGTIRAIDVLSFRFKLVALQVLPVCCKQFHRITYLVFWNEIGRVSAVMSLSLAVHVGFVLRPFSIMKGSRRDNPIYALLLSWILVQVSRFIY